ncbi:MAG: CAP domain-containing protein [Patescibacteria group bacterium]
MLKYLHHLFTPQITNNYRARILHHKIIALFIVFFFTAGILMSVTKTNFPQVLGISSDVSIDQLLILTNQKRQESGLGLLSLDERLNQAAQNKGNDMLAKGYWAHISPDGVTPWVFIKGAGYAYTYAGENLARGYTNSSDVVNAWMASDSHRQNMLSGNYSNVGFAVVSGSLNGEDTVLVVQMLGTSNLASALVSEESEKITEVAEVSQNLATEPVVVTEDIKDTVEAEKETPKTVARQTTPEVKPLINAETFSSNIAQIAITIFIFVFILDMVIIERKKILRFVGHNLDHIMFLGLILALILVLLKGYII